MREVGALRARTRVVADPGDLLALAARFPASPLVFWEHPAGGHAMLAVGVAREIRARGAERFAVAAAAAARVLATVEREGGTPAEPRMLGGFAFSDTPGPDPAYPPARVVLPRLLWTRAAGRTTLTEVWEAGDEPPGPAAAGALAAAVADGSVPRLYAPALGAEEREAWRGRVARARALIDEGAARKIVLARRRRLVADRPIDAAAMLARARAARPGCFNVWVRPRGGASLIASTPELLVRRRGADIAASALAGSAPRAADRGEDERLAAALLACAKNGREHALVVRAVRDALAAVGAEVEPPPRPEILRLPEAQHLATPVRARASRPRSAFALGGALHPTPAVCGVPAAVARALIEREEPARGWYTGALGWTDAAGDGELVVTLRSALVDGAALELWAGAGIVEGSDADAELAETEAKMRALVAPYLAPAGAIAGADAPAADAAAGA
ncbi:MAG: isochorismate synthase [Deltaproteobacteria bacterium]|nr:isochorismate synthase [Deltaproteobacteria bacterium]